MKKRRRPDVSNLIPHDVGKSGNTWFYDGKRGIEITHWFIAGVQKGERQAEIITIPWRQIEAALKRVKRRTALRARAHKASDDADTSSKPNRT